MRFAILLLGATMLAPMCAAQGEDAYPASRVAAVEPEQPSRMVLLDPSLPPDATVPAAKTKGRWWSNLVPSDRSLWLMSYVADATQFCYSEVDTMTTAHIKSGKGMREGRLGMKMLAGAGATGSLFSELHHRLRHGGNR